MTIRVCVAGTTGWVGSALTRAVHQAEDMVLSSAVSRSNKGKTIQEVLDLNGAGVVISGSVNEAGASAQPYVDGAMLAIRKVNTLRGLQRGLDTIMDV